MAIAMDKQTIKRLVAAIIFILVGIIASSAVPNIEIAWVIAILLLTIYLFAFEIVEVDVAAISTSTISKANR